MKTILVNSAKIINQGTETEKSIANIMYATAFGNLIRNGTLYRRENGIDGMPRLVITLGNTEYKCQEYLVEKLLNGNYELHPYEDSAKDFFKMDMLPKPEFVDMNQQEEKKKKTQKTKKDVKQDIEKEQENLEEPVEITLSEDKQAEIFLEQADNYRLETILNISMAVACAVFIAAVLLFF